MEWISLWLYCIIVTILISFINAAYNEYSALHLKCENNQNQSVRIESKSRKILSEIFYTNTQYLAGLAWFDAITKSLFHILHYDIQNANFIFIIAYWMIAFLLTLGSIIVNYYYSKWLMHFTIVNQGLLHAILHSFKNIYDPSYVLQQDRVEHHHNSINQIHLLIKKNI